MTAIATLPIHRRYIRWFEELSLDDVLLVGGKNASLGELYRDLAPKGVGIPNGFAVTAEAFRDFFRATGLDEQTRAVLAGLAADDVTDLQTRGRALRLAILAAELADDLREAIAVAYDQLSESASDGVDVAVRSSATAEEFARSELRRPAGDLPERPGSNGASVEGVKRFQIRHGLESDGILGKGTRAALNVSLAWRVRQIELALERLRWLPHLSGNRLVAVNIPMFHLWVWDSIPPGGAPLLGMDVIVGRALNTRTPVFVEEMRHLIFRPIWNVPPGILRREILPAIERDPDYLRRREMEIVWGPGDESGTSHVREVGAASSEPVRHPGGKIGNVAPKRRLTQERPGQKSRVVDRERGVAINAYDGFHLELGTDVTGMAQLAGGDQARTFPCQARVNVVSKHRGDFVELLV